MSQRQTPEEAMECARRGAALLDLVDPGWDAHINPDEVELDMYCGCVMAHYGGGPAPTMSRGVVKLRMKCLRIGLFDIDLEKLGFAVDVSQNYHAHPLSYFYAPLQAAWDIIFAERKAARGTEESTAHAGEATTEGTPGRVPGDAAAE